MNTHGLGRLQKYSVIAMVVAMAGFIIAKPVLANEACQHGHWDKAERTGYFEKRSAALHDKLQLTTTQEADWTAFIARIRPSEHPVMASGDELAKLSTPDRMEQVLAIKQEMLKRMEARVEATKEFYSHLTAEQRQIFDASFQSHHRHDDRG